MIDYGGDKAPGSDGFKIVLVRTFMSFLQSSDLLHRGRIDKGVNAIFLALIPKLPNPIELRDYWPISLVGCMHKALANILKQLFLILLAFLKGPSWLVCRSLMGFFLLMSQLNLGCMHVRKGLFLKLILKRRMIMWNGILWIICYSGSDLVRNDEVGFRNAFL